MACATMRAFAKVKSSAMMSRQPSVPNLIEDMKNQYKRSGGERNSRIGWKSKWIQQKADLDRPLQKILELLRLQEFNEFGDVLGAVAGDDEERVGGFDDDEVVDTDGGDEFRGAVEEIAGRVERVAGRVAAWRVRGWRNPQRYFLVWDRWRGVFSRMRACRWLRRVFRVRRAFAEDDASDFRGTWRRARKTCPRSSGSCRSRRIPGLRGGRAFP